MPDEEQQGVEGNETGGQEGGGQDDQTDDPGPIGLGHSIRGGKPPGLTRKAALDPDDPGPIGQKDLIEER